MSALAQAVCSESGFEDALCLCVGSLRRLAEYELDPVVNRRMLQLGERKEFLDETEHEELMALVAFAERRTREKLEARLALKRLAEVLPDLVQQH